MGYSPQVESAKKWWKPVARTDDFMDEQRTTHRHFVDHIHGSDAV
jgi:hypothetical protein